MSNYKIRVNSEVENKEVQGIFKILGGAWSEHVKADHYDKETDRRIYSIISVLEPTLVIILSLIVGMILLSVILPLMGIMSNIG